MEKRFIDPPDIAVDEKQCARCGLCAKICPTRIFDPAPGKPAQGPSYGRMRPVRAMSVRVSDRLDPPQRIHHLEFQADPA